MRVATAAFLIVAMLPSVSAFAEDNKVNVELNALESAEDACKTTFVVHNTAQTGVDSLKLDLVMFRKDGSIERRFVPELGPVRPDKTIVRTFTLKGLCPGVSQVLLNDVSACSPAKPTECLDNVALSSRVEGIRFYK